MLRCTCPQLRGTAELQREKYDLRCALIVRNASADELHHAKAELIRVNRMIAKHRRRYPQCTSVYNCDAGAVKVACARHD
jgi:hypothetical protein